MRLAVLILGITIVATPMMGRAQQNAVVLELFTSQGCSSCPPADALLPYFSEMPGVIALALHVDYWDYLGWKDSYGKGEFTERQKAYAKHLEQRMLYTPQVVIQGQQILIGHQEGKIKTMLSEYQAMPSPIHLEVTREGDQLAIKADADGVVIDGPFDIQLVRFLDSEDVRIEAGENAGHTLTYTHVVTDWETVGRWSGDEPFEDIIEAGPDDSLAVIVQKANTGPVVTAVELR